MLVELHWTKNFKYVLFDDTMEHVQSLEPELKNKVVEELKKQCSECKLCPGMGSIGPDMAIRDINGKTIQVENCQASGNRVTL